ncbi:hypothetical protein HanIR_Chr17g0888171 [Helianthus annuus]|nr:hypothetical protein HanIR_Chr17g0888171 [Helianthus annuus]
MQRRNDDNERGRGCLLRLRQLPQKLRYFRRSATMFEGCCGDDLIPSRTSGGSGELRSVFRRDLRRLQ